MSELNLPAGWDGLAHMAWVEGRRRSAIDGVLAVLNRQPAPKPFPLAMQAAYYLFLVGCPEAGATLLDNIRPDHPGNPSLLLNLAVLLSRSGQHAAAVDRLNDLLALTPDDATAHDTLAACLAVLGREAEAAVAGTRALELKDRAAGAAPAGWQPPDRPPIHWAAGKADVIAFSLWGSHPRYLRGAVDNALAAPALYPGWVLRFFVDDSVPAELCAALAELGADIRVEAPGQSLRQRLAWRFQVANDPAVGRFLVRDVDSTLSARERLAVNAWIASGQWFHVMRDWWSHTDLMLAGLWGGVAGVLPPLGPLLDAYRPPALETPNIDQWFLRDRVWPYVRGHCLVHDRCFTPPGAVPWPGPAAGRGFHVGQNEFATRRAAQEKRLAPWIARLECLRLP